MIRLKYIITLFIFANTLFAQTGARYLIITPDSFYDMLQPLVEWKYKKGMKPAVYKLSQIGSDSLSIKMFIQSCYQSWDIKPEFVVLVGHPGYIPMCRYPYGGNWYYTDNYYTNMDGNIYNEIIPGRLSVSSTSELETLINKVFAYERYPETSDSLWFRKGCAIARNDWDPDSIIYLSDMRYAENIATHNGYASVDTFNDHRGYNASHVINAINEGRGFVQYRGVGSVHWYDPFDVSPFSTWNGNKLPIIISTTCQTVSTSSSPILGENFIRVGTPSALRGAVGFFGGTRNASSVAHLRSATGRGFLDAMFVEKKRTFGEACEGGRYRVYQWYGELREYNSFTCLGDPDLNLWTGTPCSLVVQHPEFVHYASEIFEVTVSKASNLAPIIDAIVCVAGKADTNVYAVDTTDANGKAYFNIMPQIIEDTIFVTVTGKNLLPYEGFMIVRMMDCCYMMYLNSFIDDSLSGNNDGNINPNEEIELPLMIENLGDSTGYNIVGILRTCDTCVSAIKDSVKIFGNVIGHDTAYTGSDGYNFSVIHSCPNMHNIDFELVITDFNDSMWVYNFSHTVFAPDLVFRGVLACGGNGDNIVNAGETVQLIVTLKNDGDAPADDVLAILRCALPEVSILDSIGRFDEIGVDTLEDTTFDYIGIDSLKDNSLDPFVMSVDSGTPIGTVVDLKMIVFSDYCNDTFDFAIVVGRKNYYVWNPDPSPSSGEHIHAILTGSGYSGDYGTTLPTQLGLYQSVFVCLGVYTNRYLITTGNPEATVLTEFLNTGGRVYIEGSSVWFIDPYYFSGHDFRPLFGLSADDWSYGDMGPIAGVTGTFTNGMYFTYGGENRYMDHLDPASGFLILRDSDNDYNCGIAYDAGIYRTVGTNFELGLLNDASPPSTREALLDSIMNFFGVYVGIYEEPKLKQGSVDLTSVTTLGPLYPNPFRENVEIRYMIQDTGYRIQDSSLRIFDVSGRLVKEWSPQTIGRSDQVTWDGRDDFGRAVPPGVYFVRLEVDGYKRVEKVVLLR